VLLWRSALPEIQRGDLPLVQHQGDLWRV
jgi:hypothetical protein